VVLTAALVLVGWALDLTPLKSIAPGRVAMQPNTALCFILVGSALGLLQAPSGRSETLAAPRKLLGRACAWLALLVGLVTLGEHLLGFNAGIDDLLFRKALLATKAPFPGRMAHATAAEVILLGLALLRMEAESQGKGAASQYLALLGASIGFLALLGHAYGAPALYRVTAFSSVTLHTAFLSVVLGAAVLCARPDRGLMAPITSPTFGGLMARRMLPVALSLPFGLGWLGLQGQRAGLYGTEFGLAMFATATVLIFATLV
jgi:hypothetical protein